MRAVRWRRTNRGGTPRARVGNQGEDFSRRVASKKFALDPGSDDNEGREKSSKVWVKSWPRWFRPIFWKRN